MFSRLAQLAAFILLTGTIALSGCAEGTPSTLDAGSDADDATAFDIIEDDSEESDGTTQTDGGTCPEGCPDDLDCCNGECVNVLANPNHCGLCNTVCDSGPNGEAPLCNVGECTLECPDGTGDCDGDPSNGCETDTTTTSNCGGCQNQCGDGATCTDGSCECASGSCQCPSGMNLCDTNCVDTDTNERHCGDCNIDCPANAECVGGNCQCESGYQMCNGRCVSSSSYCSPGDTDRETRSCGSCGGQESRDRNCLNSCQWSSWSSWSACSVSNCCGDGTCSGGESCSSCPSDCGSCTSCGDGSCNGSETCSTCPTDCGSCTSCGDGSCNGSETCSTCPTDCGSCSTCGDGTCDSGESCSTCSDCQYGHETTGENGDPCSAPEETWRCVYSNNHGANVSQVCRSGEWVSYNLYPSDCSACVCDYSSACSQ